MARHPDWFERLPAIEASLAQSSAESLGRTEIEALFGSGERDAIRLLHKFGAQEQAQALSVSRSALLVQLEAVRRGAGYAAFLRRRQGVAQQLAKARSEAAAQQFRVRALVPGEAAPSLHTLPPSLTWRRTSATGPGRFSIDYDDGQDLMGQLSEFLAAAGRDRAGFFEGTEPEDTP